MSKAKKGSNWGGPRPGAGRPHKIERRGGPRPGSGRPRGSTTIALGARKIEAQIQKTKKTKPEIKEPDTGTPPDPLTYLIGVAQNDKLPLGVRMQASALVLPYLKPRLSAVAVATAPETVPLMFPSAVELKPFIRGTEETRPALPAPVAKKNAPLKKRRPQRDEQIIEDAGGINLFPHSPEPEDKLEPYRDKSIGHGIPLEPKYT